MALKIGIGFNRHTNSRRAGSEAAAKALLDGNIQQPAFSLVFCSGKHNPHEFLSGVKEVLGNTPMAGGSAIGVITSDELGYEGFEAGITVFESDTVHFKSFCQPGLNLGEKEAGVGLGIQIYEA